LPPPPLEAGLGEPVLAVIAEQTKDKSKFLDRIKYLYEHPDVQCTRAKIPRTRLVLPRHYRKGSRRAKDRAHGAHVIEQHYRARCGLLRGKLQFAAI